MLKSRKAFTLVELVIVIAVIAILAAVLIPTFSGVVDKANLIKDEQVARNLTNQFKMSSTTTTINNESDLWTALEEIYSGEYIEELKTTSKGNSFWYDTEKMEVFVGDEETLEKKLSEPVSLNKSALNAGSTRFDKSSLRLFYDRFLLIDKGTKGIGQLLNDLDSANNVVYKEVVDYLAGIKNIKGIEKELFDNIKQIIIINDYGMLAYSDGLSNVYVPYQTEMIGKNQYCYSGDLSIVDVSNVAEITLPKNVVVGSYSLVGFNQTVEGNTELDTAILKMNIKEDQLINHFEPYSTDCIISLPSGNYIIEGENIYPFPKNNSSDLVGTLGYSNKLSSFDVLAIGDYQYLDNKFYVAYDKLSSFVLYADNFKGENQDEQPSSTKLIWNSNYIKQENDTYQVLSNIDVNQFDIIIESVSNSELSKIITICIVKVSSAQFKVNGFDALYTFNSTNATNKFTVNSKGDPISYQIQGLIQSYTFGGTSGINGITVNNKISIEPKTPQTTIFTVNGDTISVLKDVFGTETFIVKFGADFTAEFTLEVKDARTLPFTVNFENVDKYLYRVGNDNKTPIQLSSLFSCDKPAEEFVLKIYDNKKTINQDDGKKLVLITQYTDQNSTSFSANIKEEKLYNDTWGSTTIDFNGVGVAIIVLESLEGDELARLNLEVVNGRNITSVSQLASSSNNILLNDIQIAANGCFVLNSGYTLFGNGFTFNVTNGQHNRYGVIELISSNIDNLRVIGDVYTTISDAQYKDYFSAAVNANGNCKITNSYIANGQVAVRVQGNSTESIVIENSTIYGGRYCNIQVRSGVLTLKNVTTINEAINVSGTKVLGAGIIVQQDAPKSTKINIEGDVHQYNWVSESDKNTLPPGLQTFASIPFSDSTYSKLRYTYPSSSTTECVNLGIIVLSSNFVKENIIHSKSSLKYLVLPASLSFISGSGYVASYDMTEQVNKNFFSNGISCQGVWSPSKQAPVAPTFSWSYPDSYSDGTINIFIDEGNSLDFDLNFISASKNGSVLPVSTLIDGVDFPNKMYSFKTGGNYILKFEVEDESNYDINLSNFPVTYSFEIEIVITIVAATVKPAEFTYTDFGAAKKIEIGEKQYLIMPDVTSTSSSIASTTYNGMTVYMPIVNVEYEADKTYGTHYFYAPIFTKINIKNYDSDGNSVTYSKSSSETPSKNENNSIFGYDSFPQFGPGNSKNNTIVSYSSYGLCYRSETDKGNTIEATSKIIQMHFTDNAGNYYIYYMQYHTEKRESFSQCVTPDTLITLTNGLQVRVDQLTGNEQLLVWNLETGKFDSAPIMFIDSDPSSVVEVIYLYFSDGTKVGVISEHGFWDYDLNKYVYLDKYASQNIGHYFAKQNGDQLERVQLIDVEIKQEFTSAWSPVTEGHLCYFVNGMLSMPGGVGGLFNIFEVDRETMMYDYESIEKDIQTYGLFTYEELNELAPLSKDMFDNCGGAYLKISIGKGNLTYEELIYMINRYSIFFE